MGNRWCGLSIIDDRREMRTREVEENLLRSGCCRQKNDDLCDLEKKREIFFDLKGGLFLCLFSRAYQ